MQLIECGNSFLGCVMLLNEANLFLECPVRKRFEEDSEVYTRVRRVIFDITFDIWVRAWVETRRWKKEEGWQHHAARE